MRLPGACGSLPGRGGARSATAGSSLGSASRITQARWPSSVATARAVSLRQGRRRRLEVDRRERAVGPGQRFLDVRLGVADERGRGAPARGGRVSASGRGDDRHASSSRWSNRRGDAPSGDGREDELLQLGPAVRLSRDALPVRMGERVNRDPVAGFAGGAANKLPGALRLGVERPLEQIEGEPARLEMVLPEQPVREEQETRGAVAFGRVPEPSRHGCHQRPADAVEGRDAGCDPPLAFEVLGVGESPEAGRQRVSERVGVLDEVGEVRAERFGARSAIGDEGDGSRGDVARWGFVGTPSGPTSGLGCVIMAGITRPPVRAYSLDVRRSGLHTVREAPASALRRRRHTSRQPGASSCLFRRPRSGPRCRRPGGGSE